MSSSKTTSRSRRARQSSGEARTTNDGGTAREGQVFMFTISFFLIMLCSTMKYVTYY